MSADVLTVAVGFSSFAVFVLIHAALCRWLHPERVLKSLSLAVLLALGIPAGIMVGCGVSAMVAVPWPVWAFMFICSALIYVLMCFGYILCVYCPYETAIRVRLVREVSMAGAEGISAQELAKRYNAEVITRLRLKRLTGSGDITEHHALYRASTTKNIFHLFEAIAGVLKKWIGR